MWASFKYPHSQQNPETWEEFFQKKERKKENLKQKKQPIPRKRENWKGI